MADLASKRLVVADVQRIIEAYKKHLIPKRRSFLRSAIPLAARGLGTFFGGPAGGQAAQILFTPPRSSQFPAYISPYLQAIAAARTAGAQRVARIQRQLDLVIPREGPNYRARLIATAGRRPPGFIKFGQLK